MTTMAARQLLRRAALSFRLSPVQRTLSCAAACATTTCRSGSSPVTRCGGILQHHHFYGTRSSSAADSYLVEVLKSEIEHELREEADKQGSLQGSPGPFEILDKPGTEEVILTRTFGNEQIAVTCLLESEYPEEDQEAEDEHDAEKSEHDDEEQTGSQPVGVLHMSVTITKETSKPALELECTFVRGADEVTIDSVSFLNKDSSKEDGPSPYEGPLFEDLDDNLQRAFHDLLKSRGLSAKVATYVMDYLSVKEHREYMRWLHNLETFFSS